MPRYLALVAAIAIVLAGCGGGADTTEPAATGLRIVAGASISDTAWARPVQALIVEVHPSVGSAAGHVVRFQSLPSGDAPRGPTAGMYVSNVASNEFRPIAFDTTALSGRAAVRVQLGPIAGEARILVSVPELGLSDTAKFTVLPGKVARVAIGTTDTTVFAGASYTIDAYATDEYGNRLGDALSFTAGENAAFVDPSGKVTAGATIGRGSVAVRVGSALDSARFTVVPSGTMTFVDVGSGKISIAKLDGSNKQPLFSPGFDPPYPNISPDGSLVTYQQNESDRWVLYLIDTKGTKRYLISPDSMHSASYPHFSGDGAWVFFFGIVARDSTPAIWRIRPNGTSLTHVVDLDNEYTPRFGVAPDGSRIVYNENLQLTVLQLTTGAKASLGEYGTFVEFSPDSRRVAFLTGGSIRIVNVDGTSPMTVAMNSVDPNAGLTWTPDGEWLLVRGYNGPILVSATTGEAISLPFANFYQFSATR